MERATPPGSTYAAPGYGCWFVSGCDANRILDVAPQVPGQAKTWLLDLDTTHRDEILASHAIPPETFDLLAAGKHDEFLRQRMEYLGELERAFMREAQVTTLRTQEAEPSPLDTDDEDIVDFALNTP